MRALDCNSSRRHTQSRPRYREFETSTEPAPAALRPILMFLSPRIDEHRPEEDIQKLISNSSASPNHHRSGPSLALTGDMESGGGRGGGGSASSSSRASTLSDQRAAARCRDREEEPAASGDGGTGSLWSRYLSLPVLLLVGVTASLAILPLVLPPLPPPPSMLMLVPVAMLVLLLVLAFMPTSSGVRAGTGPTTYL